MSIHNHITSLVLAILLLCLTQQRAASYYNPTRGAWMSRDPIAEKGGANVYGYVGSNPANSSDADGRINLLAAVGCCVLVAVAVGGTIYYLCAPDACTVHVLSQLHSGEAQADSHYAGEAQHDTQGSDADALTHCIGACRFAMNPGPCGSASAAIQAANNREGQSPANLMDVANNNAGFDLGQANPTGDCYNLCVQAIDSGQLWTFDGNGVLQRIPAQ